MAQMLTPAPVERMAVLEMREEPGRASMIDWAFLAGSSVGTGGVEEEAWRAWSWWWVLLRRGRAREPGKEVEGRRRSVPVVRNNKV